MTAVTPNISSHSPGPAVRGVAAHVNPFRSTCIESLAFRWDVGESLLVLRARLNALGRRAVLVGAKGSGKTTLLEALAESLAESLAGDLGRAKHPVVWLRLHRDPVLTRQRVATFLATPVQNTWICLDGLEQLGPWAWVRVRRHARVARGLIATSHRLGRLPLLRRHVTTAALLHNLVQELTGVGRTDTDEVWQQLGGDVRACLAHYYHLSAGLTPASGVRAQPRSAAR